MITFLPPVSPFRSTRWRPPAQLISMPACTSPSAWRRALTPGLVEHRDGALFEYAGANATEHVIGSALLDNDVVDAGAVQQLPEQQAGRARPDDRDLCLHGW